MSRQRRRSVDEAMGVGDYHFIKTLGEGSFGKVKLAANRHSNDKFAIKILEKRRLESQEDLVRAQREVRVLSLLRHPHISRLYEVIDTETTIYLVMEYCEGGELFDYIVAHRRIKEKEARVFFRSICSAVWYCHENFIIHRDLKPENLLLDADKRIKIIDFGFSNTFRESELLNTFCGSPAYAAPEMVIGKDYLGPQVDIWSLGVLLFAIVCGHLPFDDPNVNNLYKKIVTGEYNLPIYLSDDCKDLISRLLVVKPTRRITLPEIMEHPWMVADDPEPMTALLPPREPVDDVDEDAVAELLEIGFDEDELADAISNNTAGITLSSYYLVKEKREADEGEAQKLRESLASSLRTKRKKGGRSTPRTPPKSLSAGLGVIGENEELEVEPGASPAPVKAVKKKRRRHSVAVGDATSNAIDEMGEPLEPLELGDGPAAPAGRRTGKAAADEDDEDGDQLPPLNTARGGGRKRRFSLDAAMSSIANAFQKKPTDKAPLRVVKGPFSVATTSSKEPEEMMEEVERVLQENNIEYTLNNYMYNCETEMNGHDLRFEIEICKLERLTLNGLRLKRVTGDTWAYKRECLLLLSQMKM